MAQIIKPPQKKVEQLGRGKSIVNDLKVSEKALPLKNEVVRGEPIKYVKILKNGCAIVGKYKGDKLCLKTLVIIK